MKKKVRLIVIHPKLKPVVHEHVVESPSMSQLMKNFSLTGKQVCQLKANGKTSWRDSNGALHELSLSDVEEQKAPTPEERKRNNFIEIKDKQCQLLMQTTPLEAMPLRLKTGS